jgi:Ca2+:H+ antiporter
MLSLMAVALASLILPATLYTVLQKSATDTKDAILGLSRGIAILLLVLFCIYLYFQQKSPANFFEVEQQGEDEYVEESAEILILNSCISLLALLIVSFLMSVCADNLVGSLKSFKEMTHVTEGFVCFVILPTIGNTARPVAAVMTAYKNQLDTAINIVIGSVMQLTLFVMPLVVLLGWVLNQPMQLEFGYLETLCFFLGVFVVNLLVQDRKINYLGGGICVAM